MGVENKRIFRIMYVNITADEHHGGPRGMQYPDFKANPTRTRMPSTKKVRKKRHSFFARDNGTPPSPPFLPVYIVST